MVNFNSLPSSDSKSEPESFHPGFGDFDPSKKRKKKSKRGEGVSRKTERSESERKQIGDFITGLRGHEADKKDDKAAHVAERSKGVLKSLLEKEDAESASPDGAKLPRAEGQKASSAGTDEKTTATDAAIEEYAKEQGESHKDLEPDFPEFREELRRDEVYGGETIILHPVAETSVKTIEDNDMETDESIAQDKQATASEKPSEAHSEPPSAGTEQPFEMSPKEGVAEKPKSTGTAEATPLSESEYVSLPQLPRSERTNSDEDGAVVLPNGTVVAAMPTGRSGGGQIHGATRGTQGGSTGGGPTPTGGGGSAGSGGGNRRPPSGPSPFGPQNNPNNNPGNPNSPLNPNNPLAPNIALPQGPNTFRFGSGAPNTLLNVANTAANIAETDEAYRQGRRRGFVAGLVVGGGTDYLIQRRRRKRMQRHHEKTQKEQAKTHEKALEDIRWDRVREQQAQKARDEAFHPVITAENNAAVPAAVAAAPEQTRSERPARLYETTAAAPTQAPETKAAPTAENRQALKVAQEKLSSAPRTFGESFVSPFIAAGVAAGSVVERLKAERPESVPLQDHGEGHQTAAKKREQERLRQISENEKADIEKIKAALEGGEGHRIEQSAWHNIEVDKHGKAVDDGSLEYGHEYYQERAHETGPKIKQQIDEAAGEVALVAAALSGDDTAQAGRRTESGSDRTSVLADSRSEQAYQAAAQELRGGSRRGKSGSLSDREPGAGGAAGAFHSGGGSGKFAPRDWHDDPPQRSALKSVMSPPTTAAGTIGWAIVLVVLIAVFVILL